MSAQARSPDLAGQDVQPAPLRRVDPRLRVNLAPVQSSPLLAEGRVNLISVELIAERLGERWPTHRPQIYDNLERTLRRLAGPASFFIRANETDFIVVQPDASAFAAQAICFRAVDEVLSFFLGPGRRNDICVHRITRLAGERIAATPLSRRAIIEGERQESPEPADGHLLSPERWSPFLAGDGRELRVSCALEPVFELKGQARIGYRIRRTIVDVALGEALSAAEVQQLSRNDILRIDMATVARGIARLKTASPEELQLSLIVPVSYVTLSNAGGRHLVAEALAVARRYVRHGIICEVRDIEGVPNVAMLAAVSLIRPQTLFVVGAVQSAAAQPAALAGLKDAGLQGLTAECPRRLTGDAEFLAWARDVMAVASRLTRTVMLYGCAGPRQAVLAAALGATHVSLAGR